MRKKPKDRLPEDIFSGLTDEFEREVSCHDVLAFAELSGDMNPLHVDEDYAKQTKIGRRVVHGAFQIAMASEWVGMYLPGMRVLLSSVSAKFLTPLFFPCRVRVVGKIVHWDSLSNRGSAKISIIDAANSNPTAEIFMGVTLHEMLTETIQKTSLVECSLKKEVGVGLAKKVVLLLGASGAIGRKIALHLSNDYEVIAQGRDIQKLIQLHNECGSAYIGSELNSNIAQLIESALGDKKVYAIIYASWPKPPKGGLLTIDEDVMLEQIHFGSLHAINLARILFEKSDVKVGGRFLVVGSTAKLEKTTTMPSYVIGKSLLEETVKAIAPELARKNITANIIAPSLLPVGMNAQLQDGAINKIASRVPMGRLCSEDDILAAVDYFLSERSGFVSGQTLALTGG
jgi:NAD(P)-dependent dehydrogenase (short-subunit alcohol dehydrogenase family)/acyl dehydratase